MSQLTFDDLARQLFRLYSEKAYAEAYELVTQNGGHFPKEAGRVYFWRACLLSRTNETAHAQQLLQEARDAGHWFSPDQLRRDPDLEPLQGQPEFESIVAYCEQKVAEAEKDVVSYRRVFIPEHVAEPYPLLIALHGYAVSQVYFNTVHLEVWRPAVEAGWLLALPRASQVTGPDSFGWRNLELSAQEIQGYYSELCAQHPIDASRIAMGGFSAGGALAVWLAVRGIIPARGVIAVGPGGPALRDLDAWLSTAGAGVPGIRGFFVVGEQDELCLPGVYQMVEAFKSRGLPCDLEVHPDLGHDFPPNFKQSLTKALKFILQD